MYSSSQSAKPQPKPQSKSRKVPKGSHRMPDGSIMKNSDMKKKKPKPVKIEESCADTSRCASHSVKYADNLKVEETLEKKKEVKESDIFEGVPLKPKKIASKLKK